MMATEISNSMDLTQALQTIRWLDEERRKDKAAISTLLERSIFRVPRRRYTILSR